MAVVVTGATGKLGRLIIEELLGRIPADQITAVDRSPGKAADMAARGVRVHVADYDQPETLNGAFQAGDKVLLISSTSAGARHTTQHTTVIDAAKAAGVELMAYTSVLAAPTASFSIGRDHRATEQVLLASGMPYVLLRNGWYNENYTGHLDAILQHGQVFGSAGDGRVATAARADYAAAAAIVLTGSGQANTIYELSGDTAFSLAELAAEITRQSGREITYPKVSPAEYQAFMVGQGVAAADAAQLVEADAAIARGELAHTPGQLRRLIGRPTTSIADSIATALNAMTPEPTGSR
jgi:NAD(P)H dehydrogenase (quinone)